MSHIDHTNTQSVTMRETGSVFNRKEFCPIKMRTIDKDSSQEEVFDLTISEAVSLEQIIMAQQDEPNQKNCIFQVKRKSSDEKKFY